MKKLLLQQRRDKSALFWQKRFASENLSVISSTLFVAVCRQNRCAHRESPGGFDASYVRVADCGERILAPAQTKTRQAECRARRPVSRLFCDKQLSVALCRFGCAVRRAEQQS